MREARARATDAADKFESDLNAVERPNISSPTSCGRLLALQNVDDDDNKSQPREAEAKKLARTAPDPVSFIAVAHVHSLLFIVSGPSLTKRRE